MNSIENFVALLKEGKPFSFSRWGDGEWVCVLQERPGCSNCDGHAFFPDLGVALQNVLKEKPSYWLGMQGLARRLFNAKIEAWLAANGLSFSWVNSDIFHNVAGRKDFSFKQAFTERRHMLVGPEHLRSVFPAAEAFVAVPSRNCWLQYKDMLAGSNAMLEKLEPTVVGICAGMPANVLVHDLTKRWGDKHSFIDFGSVFDPLAGVKSREYMKHD